MRYGRSGAPLRHRRSDGSTTRVSASSPRRCEDDADILDLLAAPEPIGQRVYVRSLRRGNRVTTTQERMDAQQPRDAGADDRAETERIAAEFEAVL